LFERRRSDGPIYSTHAVSRNLAIPETVRDDGSRAIQLPAGLKELYSKSYGRYAHPVLDSAGHVAGFLSHVGWITSPILLWRQSRLEFTLDQLFDEPTDAIAQRVLDRGEPAVEKRRRGLIARLYGIGLRGSAGHGVVSDPAR
jgi:hypothetical protein